MQTITQHLYLYYQGRGKLGYLGSGYEAVVIGPNHRTLVWTNHGPWCHIQVEIPSKHHCVGLMGEKVRMDRDIPLISALLMSMALLVVYCHRVMFPWIPPSRDIYDNYPVLPSADVFGF